MDSLHSFKEEHIKEDCRDLTGVHDNGLFFRCEFEKLNGLTLQGCDLNGSKFKTESVMDALGFTLTLSCLSFKNVEFSPLLFDLFLSLATLSAEKLLDVIGRDRVAAILRLLRATE